MGGVTEPSVIAPEIAYYYPAPYWGMDQVDRVKLLLLFFDEIAILRPRYMAGREIAADPVLAGPLAELGLLRVLEPESFLDQQMTEDLSSALVHLLTVGTFDHLETGGHYQELSQSRMGWDADVDLASMLIEEMAARGLCRPSEDGVSVPMHPEVRTTVLVLLAQFARGAGQRQGLDLHPTTASQESASSLYGTLSRAAMPSAGHVVALDLEAVSVDVSRVPLDELLDFRVTRGQAFRAYARELRRLLTELGPLSESDRTRLLVDRSEELAERAFGLRRESRRAWSVGPAGLASFSLGLAGAAWELAGNKDPVSAALALGAGVSGLLPGGSETADAYSYVIAANRSFG